MGSIDSIETYAYRTRKGLICEKEKIKRNNIKWQYKDFWLWLYYKRRQYELAKNSDHPSRILIAGGSGSRKTNALLNLINNKPDIDKIYLYARKIHTKQNVNYWLTKDNIWLKVFKLFKNVYWILKWYG